MVKRILTLNPGSTSTKLALFEDESCIVEKNIPLTGTQSKKKPYILDELETRMETISQFLSESGIGMDSVDIVVARASTPQAVDYGAYVIDKRLVQSICFDPDTKNHASSLSPVLAYFLATRHGKPAVFYDAVSADRTPEIARMSGIPGINRQMGCHNLNTRMVGREAAQTLDKSYEQCRFVIAHLGGGFSISAHENGIIIDSLMCDEGPMSPQRAGNASFMTVYEMCFGGQYTRDDMQRITSSGGLLSYLDARDTIEVQNRVMDGDEKAEYIYRVMAYQVSKAIGQMYAALKSQADAVVLTGGVAFSDLFTGWVTEYVGDMAPVMRIPGEREMLALARGGKRVLAGERARSYNLMPSGIRSMTEMKEDFLARRPDLTGDPSVIKVLNL